MPQAALIPIIGAAVGATVGGVTNKGILEGAALGGLAGTGVGALGAAGAGAGAAGTAGAGSTASLLGSGTTVGGSTGLLGAAPTVGSSASLLGSGAYAPFQAMASAPSISTLPAAAGGAGPSFSNILNSVQTMGNIQQQLQPLVSGPQIEEPTRPQVTMPQGQSLSQLLAQLSQSFGPQ